MLSGDIVTVPGRKGFWVVWTSYLSPSGRPAWFLQQAQEGRLATSFPIEEEGMVLHHRPIFGEGMQLTSNGEPVEVVGPSPQPNLVRCLHQNPLKALTHPFRGRTVYVEGSEGLIDLSISALVLANLAFFLLQAEAQIEEEV